METLRCEGDLRLRARSNHASGMLNSIRGNLHQDVPGVPHPGEPGIKDARLAKQHLEKKERSGKSKCRSGINISRDVEKKSTCRKNRNVENISVNVDEFGAPGKVKGLLSNKGLHRNQKSGGQVNREVVVVAGSKRGSDAVKVRIAGRFLILSLTGVERDPTLRLVADCLRVFAAIHLQIWK
ncbi:hypothetical protein DFH06DRAFT_1139262 [Mycena polygramma]|nr:hypothetical protein DFH06DRAFT_1139262 [Mycena polygramma]